MSGRVIFGRGKCGGGRSDRRARNVPLPDLELRAFLKIKFNAALHPASFGQPKLEKGIR